MKKAVLTFGLLVLVFMGAVLTHTISVKESKNEKTLSFSLPFDIYSLDVNSRAHDGNSATVIKLLFEGLMTNTKNGITAFALAHKVDINADGTKYTFYLRDSRWSDGVPVTAHDFEYSWKRALNPNSKYVIQSPHYLYSIRNAENCVLGKTPIDSLGVQAIDEKTLVVELEYSDPYFLNLTACCLCLPIPKHIASKNPDWAARPEIVCNGPFVIEKWKLNNFIKLRSNPHYWDQNSISLNQIDISIVSSTLTSLQMFEKGKLDWVGDPLVRMPSDFYRSLEEKKLIQKSEGSTIYWFFLNTEKYPLNNKKLRKALAYAIDRKSLLENIFYSYGSPARSILAPSLNGVCTEHFQDNTEIAKQLFQEALEELGISQNEFPVLEFSCVSNLETHNYISQAIQDQWRKNLGINISIRMSEWHSYYSAVSMGNYDIGFMSWRIDLPDPKYLLQIFENKNDLANISFWENTEFKETIQKMRTSVGEFERSALISKAERILMEEMPVIPLVFLNQVYAKNPRLKGEILTPFPPIDFKSAYIEASN